MIIKSQCVCQNDLFKFRPLIEYKNETVFKDYEGISIYKCLNCGLLKTKRPKDKKFDYPDRSKYYEKNKALFKELLGPVVCQIRKFKQKGRVLDVGCSSGILLELLKQQNFDVFGIEPEKGAYKIAQNKFPTRIFKGTLKDFIASNRLKFDIIIYNHVFEHVQDPIFELKLIKKVLKKQGILVLGLPNTSNVIFYLRNKYWESLMPGEHIWHFSKKQITNLLKKSKFLIVNSLFSDDKRLDYPLVKRIYFKFLSLINKILDTGEAMLLICKQA